jgi:ABC-type Zn2+ transport system substrate-binding protein/surface adhesin
MNSEEAEKHCDTKIIVRLDDMRGLWTQSTDKQRLEIIKSIIWTAPDMCSFYKKVLKELDPKKFERTLD